MPGPCGTGFPENRPADPISNVECRMSREGIVSILKRTVRQAAHMSRTRRASAAEAKPSFEIRVADHVFSVIRYSAALRFAVPTW
jgi:hypothetical protein